MIHIAYCLNRDFLLPFAASLTSVVENSDAQNITIHVLHKEGELSRKHHGRLRRRVYDNINFIEIPRERLGELDNPRFGVEAFYKTLIPLVLPDDIERVIYLDCDTIVLGDVNELWTVDLGGHYLAAVQDAWTPYVSAAEGVARWQELGYSADIPFFNSGLMVLSLHKFRADDIPSRARDHAVRFREQMNVFGDQEAFNALLGHKWKSLDLTWNVLSTVYRLNDPSKDVPLLRDQQINRSNLIRDAKMIHFTGYLQRPWKPVSFFASVKPHPERARFNYYLRRSGWFTPAQWYRYRAGLLTQSLTNTLKDASRSLRHRTRRSLHRHFGVDIPFLGGGPSTS